MTQVRSGPGGSDLPTGWLETLESDPLGLATHRHGEQEPPPAPGAARRDLLRLGLGVAAIIGLGFLSGHGETVLIVLALIACIVAHEAGHFVAARSGGVKVTEFFVGFGPRLWSVRRGETEYGIKAIPAGGYVKILGMTSAETPDW